MSLEKFIDAQIKIQYRLGCLTNASDAWTKQFSDIKKHMPKNTAISHIDKIFKRPDFILSGIDQYEDATKLMEPFTFPVRDLTQTLKFTEVFNHIEKFSAPNSVIDAINNSLNAHLEFRTYDLSEPIEDYEDEENTSNLVFDES
ncbi:hypothetical protein [Winogradskyella wichelsiae]|uniref:hypothetical protein n=1 Tax=Winogradskyella wichelsiae TaxID=2697007 RepID=UPI003EF8AD0F